MERDYTTGAGTAIVFNFNSHAHVERDLLRKRLSSFTFISTHTLTWSVTRLAFEFSNACIYFNSHAHVERDHSRLQMLCNLLYFNSHAHVERDHHVELTDGGKYNFNSHAHVERDQFSALYLIQIGISTHTLTWSVTMVIYKQLQPVQISTHTLTWSVTGQQSHLQFPAVFQLTRSRGA